ncbi:MAG: plasmid mobilization relaxosome protein MobC [Flavobacteriaceae bacterium]|nr:plasmid mobilization relaxosome protein MobC [Flavobacteriaceae bacterium]
MKQRGRPKKEEHEKRTARLPAVRLTRAERIDLELKAERAGVDLSEWVRQQLTAAPIKRPRAPALSSVISALNRIGNNVNQIARQLNRGRDHDPEHLGFILQELHTVLDGLVRRYGS